MTEFLPKSDRFDQKVRQSFAAQGLMQSFQARIDRLAAGTCQISAPIRPETSQQQGYAHAGLTFSLGDSAAGFSALSLMDDDHEVVTAEIKINLISPAVGERLIARGRVIRPGRRLFVVTADVYAESAGQLVHVALLQGTMIPVPTAG